MCQDVKLGEGKDGEAGRVLNDLFSDKVMGLSYLRMIKLIVTSSTQLHILNRRKNIYNVPP